MLNNFDIRMFKKAKEVAAHSDYRPHRLGCVIVYKKHIIGSGYNSTKTHPKQKQYNKLRKFKKSVKPIQDSGHAEIRALMNIPYPIGVQIDWKKVKVYIYRISPGKKLGMGLAAPCPACRQALIDAGICHLYYTGDESFIYERLI